MPAPARPTWMTAAAIYCAATVCVTVFSDLLVPAARDTEVWGGFELHGTAALLTAPIHWTLFAVLAWGFWSVRPWAPSVAGVYAFYVAVCHLVWSVASPHGRGWVIGLVEALVISAVGMLLLRGGAPTGRETTT